MKTRFLLLLAALLTLSTPAQAGDLLGAQESLAAAQDEARHSGNGYGLIAFQIRGTWSGTLTFEASNDNTTWVAVPAMNQASGASATTTTANGIYIVSPAAQAVRARMSAYTSGTAIIVSLSKQGVTAGGGASGGATATNQTSGGQKTQIVDGSGNVVATTSNNLNVQCANCSGSGAAAADSATFTNATSSFAPAGGFFQTTATTNPLATGRQGMVQMTANRAFHINLRNASGTEVGTSGAPVRMDPTGTTTQPVSLTSTTITGTVAATQSGAWTLQPGNTANTTAWLVTGTGGTFPVTFSTTGSGNATGALRVELPTNGTGVIATVGAVTAITNALPAGANAIGKLAANSGVNIGDVNPATPANWAVGATGSAVPANAQYTGAVSRGNLTGIIQADTSAIINASTATTTQLVALTSTQKIYITAWDVIAAGTGTIKLVYGTGSSCGTGTTDLTPAYSLVAQAGLTKGSGLGPILVVPASNALCVTTSAAVGMQGTVSYTKF